MARQSGYSYDESVGGWGATNSSPVDYEQSVAGLGDYSSDEIAEAMEATMKQKETGSSSTSASTETKDNTDKKYREIEYCTLEGSLDLIPTKRNLLIHAGDTIYLKGVGSYLSGKYYVTTVKRELSGDSGFSLSWTVIKTGFGDSLKKVEIITESDRAKAIDKKVDDFKVGDKVKIYGDDAVYSNPSGKKVPDWVKEKNLTISKLSSSGDSALLKEIVSWTYTKYLKSV